MLSAVLDIAENVLGATSASGASSALFEATRRYGVTYLQTRRYRRPAGPLTSERHWRAGGFIVRHAKPGWVDSAEFNYICFECNPLVAAIEQGRTRYRFSSFAPRRDAQFARYWEAFARADIGDALCATAYGPDRGVASLHLGVGDADIEPGVALLLQTAGSILVEKILAEVAEAAPREPDTALLSVRERDALSFVAEGKTDWEIARIFGVSETTARFHVDNARKKLGATNRAHAVAKFVAQNGL